MIQAGQTVPTRAPRFLSYPLAQRQQTFASMHGAVANPFFNSTPKGLMRRGVEETLQVGIHHMGVVFLDQRIHFPQGLFRAASRPKAVTGLLKLLLKDRFDHQLEGRLHDAVFNQQFASGCSPHCLTTMQLPSATELWHTPTRTFTVLMWRPHGRTIPPTGD